MYPYANPKERNFSNILMRFNAPTYFDSRIKAIENDLTPTIFSTTSQVMAHFEKSLYAKI